MSLPAIALASAAPKSPRCNARVASELEDRVRSLQAQPKDSDADVRFVQLHDAIAAEAQEENVLEAACNTGSDLQPIQSDLRISQALALMLQFDVMLRKIKTACPQGGSAASGLLAASWRELVLSSPESGAASQAADDIRRQIQTRADTLDLALPSPADTSNYWLTTVQKSAREAISRCPQ